METTKVRYARVALIAVVTSIMLFAGAGRQAWAGSPVVLEGTGTFSSVVIRTTSTLDPPCVSLVTRVGTVDFTGFIKNTAGNFLSHAVRDACADPVQGPTKQTYDLLNATVAGRTGQLHVEAEGIFEGDATTPPPERGAGTT
jgi:hypothetical protein